MAKKTVEKKTPARGGHKFSERYYQEQIADLVMENKELKGLLDQSMENTEGWKKTAKNWERASWRWERNTTHIRKQLYFALLLWPVIWIICKIAELCWK